MIPGSPPARELATRSRCSRRRDTRRRTLALHLPCAMRSPRARCAGSTLHLQLRCRCVAALRASVALERESSPPRSNRAYSAEAAWPWRWSRAGARPGCAPPASRSPRRSNGPAPSGSARPCSATARLPGRALVVRLIPGRRGRDDRGSGCRQRRGRWWPPHGGLEGAAVHRDRTRSQFVEVPSEPFPLVPSRHARTNARSAMADSYWRSLATGEPLPPGGLLTAEGRPTEAAAHVEGGIYRPRSQAPRDSGSPSSFNDILGAALAGGAIGREVSLGAPQRPERLLPRSRPGRLRAGGDVPSRGRSPRLPGARNHPGRPIRQEAWSGSRASGWPRSGSAAWRTGFPSTPSSLPRWSLELRGLGCSSRLRCVYASR